MRNSHVVERSNARHLSGSSVHSNASSIDSKPFPSLSNKEDLVRSLFSNLLFANPSDESDLPNAMVGK